VRDYHGPPIIYAAVTSMYMYRRRIADTLSCKKGSQLLELHHQNSPTLPSILMQAFTLHVQSDHRVLTDMNSALDNSTSRLPLRQESGDSEGEECGSGYDDEECTQQIDPRPLTGESQSY